MMNRKEAIKDKLKMRGLYKKPIQSYSKPLPEVKCSRCGKQAVLISTRLALGNNTYESERGRLIKCNHCGYRKYGTKESIKRYILHDD